LSWAASRFRLFKLTSVSETNFFSAMLINLNYLLLLVTWEDFIEISYCEVKASRHVRLQSVNSEGHSLVFIKFIGTKKIKLLDKCCDLSVLFFFGKFGFFNMCFRLYLPYIHLWNVTNCDTCLNCVISNMCKILK
jgi:hypothetical protein